MTTKRVAQQNKKTEDVEFVTRKQPKGVREIHFKMLETPVEDEIKKPSKKK